MASESLDEAAASVLRLRWNSHLENLQELFDSLLEQQLFVDVTLACEGGTLRAHRLMLSACSAYFRRVLRDATSKHPVIIMRDVHRAEMDAILQFIYRGEIHVPESRLPALLRTARLLEIRGLSDHLGTTKPPPPPPGGSDEEEEDDDDDEEEELIDCHAPSGLNGAQSAPLQFNGKKGGKRLNQQGRAENGTAEPETKRRAAQNKDSPSKEVRRLDVDGGASDEENEMPQADCLPPGGKNHHSSGSPVPVLVKCEALDYHNPTGAETEDPGGADEENDAESVSTGEGQGYPFSMLEDQSGSGVVVQAVCPFCFKDCKRTAELRAHIRAHTGEKPFRCDICSAPFARSAHLKRHRRVHTGERPFECHRCQKTFSRQDKLKLHMDRHRLRDTGGKMIVGRPKKSDSAPASSAKGKNGVKALNGSDPPSNGGSSNSAASAAPELQGMGQFAFPGAPARPNPAQSPMSSSSSGLPSPGGIAIPFSDISYFSLLSLSQRQSAATQPSSSTQDPQLTAQDLQMFRKAAASSLSPKRSRQAVSSATARGRLTRHSSSSSSAESSASETLLNFAQQVGGADSPAADPPVA